ncbi:DNA packaging terminase subunit 2 [Equid gammaherpesvirus 5]|uniref:DNA packaging terminase subunit 2 n=1 Tax=Equid gammaherpesvirus 5 TaxID=10371 RepID=A0A0B4Q6A1_9GAMA|nr:DNA packaging terminase subunit 2 [Equid gammaherpesvirus 5]AIU39534.1 DNA packaging terminase subunit 2 [Equid gammaherpesvirus 5]APT43374.1 DNA packaging terminase subunit 2 [Equid gammaherpesvirus 5]
MARELAAVYAQVFDLATETALLMYCDPLSIDTRCLINNKNKVLKLCETLLPCLRVQNDLECSPLSLELQHLLQNTLEALTLLVGLLSRNHPSRVEFFEALHSPATPCDRHARVRIGFYGGGEKIISLSLLNDVEVLFKRLNSVFYCLPAEGALEALDATLEFLGRLRGVSPVPPPDAYVSSVPCVSCFAEAAMLPNQGESVLSMLAEVNCNHVCRQVPADPVMGVFENELRHLGAKVAAGGRCVGPGMMMMEEEEREERAESAERDEEREGMMMMEQDEEEEDGGGRGEEGGGGKEEREKSELRCLTETSLSVLAKHTIFEKNDSRLSEISNLVYWSSAADKSQAAAAGGGPGAASSSFSHMAKLFANEARMHKNRDRLPAGPRASHYFDAHSPSPFESLFCGGVFNSIDDTVSALQKDCSATFLKKSNYQSLIQRQNELYVRLNAILHKTRKEEGKGRRARDNEPLRSEGGAGGVKGGDPRDVLADAQVRRDLYLKKLTKDGLRRLTDCIETHGRVLSDTLSLRVWGGVVYASASRLKNHFLFRRQFVSRASWADRRAGDRAAFENSKYIKNALHGQRLNREHLDSIIVHFYKLITGPLSLQNSHFPVPDNVALAYCLDAAGVMPHQKLVITEMIWPGIESRDWVDTNFNSFYSILAGDLNLTQKMTLNYIREAVLSISLYNTVWEKSLSLFPATELRRNCVEAAAAAAAGELREGVYLTYEEGAPLVLLFDSKGYVFKDLYTLLYTHLQLSGSQQKGVGDC